MDPEDIRELNCALKHLNDLSARLVSKYAGRVKLRPFANFNTDPQDAFASFEIEITEGVTLLCGAPLKRSQGDFK